MRNLMFVLTLLAASTVVASAQDTTAAPGQDQYRTDPTMQDQTTGQDMNTGKEMISTEELPQSITDQLQGQDYNSWTVEEASRRMRGEETIYEVELTSGDQMKKMRFDAQGNILKEKTKRRKN